MIAAEEPAAMHPPLRLPHRRAAPHPWRPMTDAEWAWLEPALNHRRGAGRPPRDLRATWDAIFWVACSRAAWDRLPAGLGRHDSAHRALRRAAASGLLGRLLIGVSDYPVLGGFEALRWRICRAARRVARLLTMAQLLMVERLGLRDALPADPAHLPRPDLSETLRAHAALIRFPVVWPTLISYLRGLHARIGGRPALWRLTD